VLNNLSLRDVDGPRKFSQVFAKMTPAVNWREAVVAIGVGGNGAAARLGAGIVIRLFRLCLGRDRQGGSSGLASEVFTPNHPRCDVYLTLAWRHEYLHVPEGSRTRVANTILSAEHDVNSVSPLTHADERWDSRSGNFKFGGNILNWTRGERTHWKCWKTFSGKRGEKWLSTITAWEVAL